MSVAEEHPTPTSATSPTVHLTSAAVEKIQEMLEEEGLLEEGGLRISAHFGAGCSTPLQFDLVMEVEPQEEDSILQGPGIRIFISPRSAWAVDGLRLDYVDSPLMGSGFAFQHPRGRSGRAC